MVAGCEESFKKNDEMPTFYYDAMEPFMDKSGVEHNVENSNPITSNTIVLQDEASAIVREDNRFTQISYKKR